MTRLMRFPDAIKHNPSIDAWVTQQDDELGTLAQHGFNIMRNCGDDIRELLHDGHPTACVNDAAFAYVNAFTAHVNVGFFLGAQLHDPHHLLEGTGRFMRHVKLKPGQSINNAALEQLIRSAYSQMKQHLRNAQD